MTGSNECALGAAGEPPGDGGSDAWLLGRLAEGDLDAMGVLWARYYADALRYARRQEGRIDPEDMVAEAFTRLAEVVLGGRGGPRGPVGPYLFVIIRNLALKSWRERSIVLSSIPEETLAEWVDPVDVEEDVVSALVCEADGALVASAFDQLPARWQEVLWYTVVQGMPAGEAGRRMGLNASTVASLSYRARRGLRAHWSRACAGATGEGDAWVEVS